jgi:hypothetical protein
LTFHTVNVLASRFASACPCAHHESTQLGPRFSALSSISPGNAEVQLTNIMPLLAVSFFPDRGHLKVSRDPQAALIYVHQELVAVNFFAPDFQRSLIALGDHPVS